MLEKTAFSEVVISFKVYCPGVAGFCNPGQFVVVRTDEMAERLPLTIADFNREEGWITLVVQIIGAGTRKVNQLEQGDHFLDIVGPLGHKSEMENFGTVVCVGGGLGVAPVFPIQRALKAAGNRVISIMGARNADLLFWKDRLESCADELHVVTDDGSAGEKGFVTTVLQRLIDQGETINRVIAIGPVVMMRAVTEVTRPAEIPTVVSLNSIMIDGTGMCGGCRVEVGAETRFTCVDGPEFDAHQVNFDLLISRLALYGKQEQRALELLAGGEGEGHPAMPELTPKDRCHNFEEVAQGYDAETAEAEARRCLQCKKPLCSDGCPVSIDIPAFIACIAEGDMAGAAAKLKEENFLPAVCGRVCPQETQCEARCILGKKGTPIAIGTLERFAADWEAAQGEVPVPARPEPSGKRVAVIGAGPAGLSAAADLAMLGHQVTIFEALHMAGGVLVYGIPEFRLPKAIVQRECDFLTKLGVELKLNVPVGSSMSVPDLMATEGYAAVFVGTGAGLPKFLGIEGENLAGVYSSNEYLTRVNLMKAYRPEYDTPIVPGRHVAVVGGGNVAMDAARCALRLGAENVYIIYRRTREEMPARAEEVKHALEEGVQFKELNNPTRILSDGEGLVTGLECLCMELGEPDDSGRRRPVAVAGSEHVIPVDQVIIAIGQGPNPILTKSWPELELDKRGNIPINEVTMTNVPGVFAGGDVVTGAATVIEAMGAGKKAAKAIDTYLSTVAE
ncbi:MAG: NADPH-dependent glutamate synthase [Planctomycetota bacterium]